MHIPYGVDCRIGSLEIKHGRVLRYCYVDCRVGSLENGAERVFSSVIVDCRIGSLEKSPFTSKGITAS